MTPREHHLAAGLATVMSSGWPQQVHFMTKCIAKVANKPYANRPENKRLRAATLPESGRKPDANERRM
jgi:hypothetical protein